MNFKEVNISRQELKFYIDNYNIIKLRKNLKRLTNIDSYSDKETKDYQVTSLYFDTKYDKNLDEKLDGILSREKMRIRIYKNNSTIKLEFKKREDSIISKDSLVISKQLAKNIINNNYFFNDYKGQLLKAYIKIKSKGYLPRVIVEYDREAYINLHGKTRITIDKNLRTYSNETNLFNIKNPSIPIFKDDLHILEVKFTNYLPDQIKYALNSINVVPHSISKYTHCQKFINNSPWRDEIFVPS